MSDEHRFERDARAWLELGPTDAPDRVVEAALFEIEQTSQERDFRVPWRFTAMNSPLRLAAAAVVGVVALGLIYLNLPGRNGNDVGPPGPTPTALAATSTPRPTDPYPSLPGWIVFEHGGDSPETGTSVGAEAGRGLWLVHADGTGLHELAPGIPESGKISFDISPDGTKVAYGAFDIPVQIWQVGIEGGEPELLTTDCSGQPGECADGGPAYSSDGSRVAFVRGTDQGYVVAILDLATDSVTLLEATRSTSPDGWLAEPSWSPDDQQIVYHDVIVDVAQDEVVDANLFVVNVDGTGRQELEFAGLEETSVGDADWSPDGSRLVFSTCPIHDFNAACAAVYTARVDGTDVQLLTPTGVGYGAPSWTPDGAYIMYWGPRTFHLMEPDGSNARPINRDELSYAEGDGFGYYALFQPMP
jgi:TolB protein